MTRKSQSTQRQRNSGQPTGSARSRSTAANPTRQSASSQRNSAQADRGRTRSDPAKTSGRGRRPDDNQEWNFSQPQRPYDDARRGGERSFDSRDDERGREHPAYSSQNDRDRGFFPRDQEYRGEFASREGRSSQGRSQNPEQNERRFTREMDSYYGRSARPQDNRERSFQGDDDFRPSSREETGAWPQNSRENEYRSSQSRYEPARSSHDDYNRRPYSPEDYSSGARQQDERDDFRREEGYDDQDRGYQGSSREDSRYHQEDDDRFYAGRGPRSDSDSESSGQRRQSGSRSGRSTGSSRRRG